MTERPRRRTTSGAVAGDPQTYTETQVASMVAAAIADHIAEQQRIATERGVDQLKAEFSEVRGRFDEVLDKVQLSNNIKHDIVNRIENLRTEVTTVQQAHAIEVAPIRLSEWALHEKEALRPTVLDYLERTAGRVLFAGKWKRRGAIVAAVVGVAGLVITAVGTLYTVFAGVAHPLIK